MQLRRSAGQGPATPDSQTFTAGPVATSFSEISAVGDTVHQPEPFDTPGGFASWTSGKLAKNLDVAGIPSTRFQVSSVPAKATGAVDPIGQLTIFAKLYDFDPATKKLVLVNRLISPVRVAHTGQKVDVQLPGIVHRFPAGHELKLVVAGSDQATTACRRSSP